jgi:hypothetical protein
MKLSDMKIGKKYLGASGIPRTCVGFNSEGFPVLEGKDPRTFFITKFGHAWGPVPPKPVVIERWVNVYKNGRTGGIFTNEIDCREAGGERGKVVKLKGEYIPFEEEV